MRCTHDELKQFEMIYEDFHKFDLDTQIHIVKTIIKENHLTDNLSDFMNVANKSRLFVRRFPDGKINCIGFKFHSMPWEYLMDDNDSGYEIHTDCILNEKVLKMLNITPDTKKIIEKGFTLRQGDDKKEFHTANQFLLDNLQWFSPLGNTKNVISIVNVNNHKGINFTKRFGFNEVCTLKSKNNTSTFILFHKETGA